MARRSHSSVFLLIYLATITTRIHAQAVPDYMLVGASQEPSLESPPTDWRDGTGEQTQDDLNVTPSTDMCKSPPQIEFAELKEDLEVDSFPEGTTIRYKCKTGYAYVPGKQASVKCLEDNTWSIPETFCRRNGCPEPPHIPYGQPREQFLGKTEFAKSTTITYMCRPGYVRVPGTKPTITCLHDFTWSSPDIFCRRRSCGNPGEVANGDMKAEDFLFGSNVTYVCNKGYRMISKRNYRECLADGSWSNDVPVCDVQTCNSPPKIRDGDFTPKKEDYTYLDSVTYQCKRNLDVFGERSISCMANGEWSSKAPVCKAIECSYPSVPRATKVSGAAGPYRFNSVVRFQCNSQYMLTGYDTVTCNENSQWEPELPKCVAICYGVPYLGSAELEVSPSETSFIEGTELKIKCKPGFEPKHGARNTVSCRGTSWSDPGEFCTRISCGHPEERFYTGTIGYPDMLFETKMTYGCNIGYKLKSNKYRVCQANGTWSLPIPECEVQTCPVPDVNDGFYSPQKENYRYNDIVTYQCREGFWLIGGNSSTCSSDGRWYPKSPECKGICHSPPELQYARPAFILNQETFFIGTKLAYICKPGYTDKPLIERTLTCLGNFRWSTPEEFCTRISCGNPGEIPNAELQAKDFLFESEAIYTCKTGYHMATQHSSRKCHYNGRWSDDIPVCEVQKCSPPEDLPGGSYSVKKEVYTYNESVTYVCDKLTLVGERSISCTADGNWTSDAPECKAVCKPPPELIYGELEEEFTQQNFSNISTTVQYKCRPGFVPVDGIDRTITCHEDLTWSEPELFCTRNGCPEPPHIPYGQPREQFLGKTEFAKSTTITYMCRPGYVRVPGTKPTITCLHDFTWSSPDIFCRRRSCGNPGEVANGDVEAEDFLFGSNVTYVCNKGYRMISKRNYRECLADGSWSNDVPVCEVQTCNSPPEITDVDFTPKKEDYTYLDSVTYQCKRNLDLLGERSISCTANGEWSSKAPVCKAIECSYPSVPRATKLSGAAGPYRFNSVVRFQCNSQYMLTGSDTVTCNENSQWEPELPKCVGMCIGVPYLSSAEPEVSPSETSFIEGTELKIKCKPGFKPIPGARNTVSCMGVSWSDPGEFCTRISCGHPEERFYTGTIGYPDMLFETKMTYGCNIGYKLKSNKYRVCQANGTWSLPVPECEVQACPIPDVNDGFYSPQKENYQHNDIVTYKCKNGFRLIGGVSSTCSSDGRWYPTSPECKAQTCPVPDVIDGFYSPQKENYRYNDIVTYQCREGFRLVGGVSSTCGSGGRWSPKSPECKGFCHSPPELQYARPAFILNQETFFTGTKLAYICKPGYNYKPPIERTLTCLGNLRWSTPEEFCTRISCGNPGEILNAELQAKYFLFESEAIYTCKTGYHMATQHSSRKCQYNGHWSDDIPVCEVQKCSPPQDLLGGSYSVKKEVYTYNESVTYVCDKLTLVGERSISCTADGNWSSDAPECKAVCKPPPELIYGELEEELIQQNFSNISTTVQYKCRPGFDPVGGMDRTITCHQDLTWSEPELFCTRRSCGSPGDIDHGKMQSTSFLFGSRVNYTCNPEYTMIARTNYRECQADGTWSGKAPVCKESACEKIWELQEEARTCTSTPDEWIKYLQVQYLYLQIENLKLDIEIKKKQLLS